MTGNIFQLGRRSRKAILTLHVVVCVAWIGVDLALLALDAVALTTSDGALVAACVSAIVIIIPPVVPVLVVAMMVSGVVLGLGTKWGLVTHWWVSAKLIIAVVLTLLVAILLLPNALSMATPDPTLSADRLRDQFDLISLLMPPIVSSVALITATALSVYKPAGRVPRPLRVATSGRVR